MKYKFDPKMYKTVANNINKYRKEKGFSIQVLSEQTEISESYLEKILGDKEDIVISIYDLYKISVILEVSIDKFFK